MCIKIIGTEEKEFDPTEPLQNQVGNASKIVVSYDPYDLKICSFEGQVEQMVRNGVSCKADIEVKTNNFLDGIRLERRLEKLKMRLEVNEVVKSIVSNHQETDRKLREMSNICLGEQK